MRQNSSKIYAYLVVIAAVFLRLYFAFIRPGMILKSYIKKKNKRRENNAAITATSSESPVINHIFLVPSSFFIVTIVAIQGI